MVVNGGGNPFLTKPSDQQFTQDLPGTEIIFRFQRNDAMIAFPANKMNTAYIDLYIGKRS